MPEDFGSGKEPTPVCIDEARLNNVKTKTAILRIKAKRLRRLATVLKELVNYLDMTEALDELTAFVITSALDEMVEIATYIQTKATKIKQLLEPNKNDNKSES